MFTATMTLLLGGAATVRVPGGGQWTANVANTTGADPMLPASLVSSNTILGTMSKVNGYFQANNLANNDWTGGVYMAGNMVWRIVCLSVL